MRAFTFIILVHMVLTVYSATPTPNPTGKPAATTSATKAPTTTQLPFSVDCSTKSLKLNNNDQTIVGADGCTVKNGTNTKTFTLDDICLSNGTVILEKTNPGGNGIVTAVETYNVTCENDHGVILVVNSNKMNITGQTKDPLLEAFTASPNVKATSVHLKLSSTDPTNGELTAIQSVTTAYLGQTLYLALYSDQVTKGIMNVIPLFCEAYTADKAAEATLWKLHNETTECYYEKQVVDKIFSQTTSKNGIHIYVAKIEAFRFRDNQDAEIIFSCEVRVCSTETGLCGEEKKAVENCPGSVTGRRRRDTEDSEMTRGRVDQVTTRLRVIDNVVTYAGATKATFTVNSLVMAAVAMVIL